MTDIVIAAILVLVVGAAVLYIYKAKKSGKKCIGCPYEDTCGAKNKENSCSCDCFSKTE